MEISRRGVLVGTGAAGVSASSVAAAAAADERHGDLQGSGGRARRREFVISGARILSMDPEVGDFRHGDVHVRHGKIVAVGRHLRGGGKRIDGSGMIVMPGLVDTHWHLWTSLYRSMSSSNAATAYFALNVANGVRCLPTDLYHGARLGLVDALNTGITTVHDWAHNLRSPRHANQNLRAHAEIGLRGRFSYGTAQGQAPTEVLDLDDIARVKREWFDSGRLPLMHLGLAGRPPGLVEENVFRPEYEFARCSVFR